MGSDGWRSLGDRYYQKQELVAEMEWPEVDLSMYMVAGAKFVLQALGQLAVALAAKVKRSL